MMQFAEREAIFASAVLPMVKALCKSFLNIESKLKELVPVLNVE